VRGFVLPGLEALALVSLVPRIKCVTDFGSSAPVSRFCRLSRLVSLARTAARHISRLRHHARQYRVPGALHGRVRVIADRLGRGALSQGAFPLFQACTYCHR
jgi:hypothetical protein